ncbi:MAG: dihydrofolate reductase family protein [Solirubrobacteraceae bacterium]
MSPETTPATLTPLLGGSSQPLTARQVVERLRTWEPNPPTDPSPLSQRPHVLLNMVCTADGRATLGGRSGPIGDRGDRELFHALRTAVDAVLVGAGTVRAERYHRLVREEAHRQLRHARGLAEEPLACVVSASLTLAADIPLLTDPAARIAILTPSPTGELPGSASPVEYVRAARDDGTLDLPAALGELRARLGVHTLLCEGGPHLNGQLLAAGLVDELFLSLAPKLGGGVRAESPRIVSGPELDPPVELELLDALESRSNLLLHYRVGGAR